MQPLFYDIAVIGAGMFGSAAAKYLSVNQSKVVLIGPEEPINKEVALSQLSFGSYYDQARITRRLGWDEVWAATDSRSLNRYRDIEKESGVPFFHETGSLVLMAKSIIKRTNSIIKQSQDNSIHVEMLTQESIENNWPYLKTPKILGGVDGLYEEKMAGYINPRKLVKAQLSIFEGQSGTLLRGEVMKICKDNCSNLWNIYVLKNGNTEIIHSNKVLVAAGSFINQNQILPIESKLELYTFTEPNLLFEIDEAEVSMLKNMPTIITVDPQDIGNQNMSSYLLPPIKYPDGKYYLRIGPGMQPIVKQLNTFKEMREWYVQQKITKDQREFLIRMQKILIPNVKVKSIKEACCIIEKTPTHYPYIGQINDDPSLNIVTGGNGHGARGSDEIGRIAANLVLGDKWDFPIDKSLGSRLA
jgi:sarcosine oxidase